MNLKIIGNPIRLPQRVDKGYRLSEYIRTSMRVVDLIPVFMHLDITKFATNNVPVSYEYQKEIETYQNDCKLYKLSGADDIAGLRCFLTDETTSQEDISNTYEDSFLQTMISELAQSNKIVKTLAAYRGMAHGFKASTGEFVDKKADELIKRVTENKEFAETVDPTPFIQEQTRSGVGQLLKNILIHGHSVALPKIWLDSSYNPSLQLNIKLVSPYGSQKAIKKFIVEPLIYLLLLAVPKTSDGISYGWPRQLKVKYYGSANINVGYVSNISIRRGGDDTTYNQYRQPLSVFVSMTINPLTTGFAAFSTEGGCHKEDSCTMDCFDKQEGLSIELVERESKSMITTVGNIIESFKPFFLRDIKQEIQHLSSPATGENLPNILNPNTDVNPTQDPLTPTNPTQTPVTPPPANSGDLSPELANASDTEKDLFFNTYINDSNNYLGIKKDPQTGDYNADWTRNYGYDFIKPTNEELRQIYINYYTNEIERTKIQQAIDLYNKGISAK